MRTEIALALISAGVSVIGLILTAIVSIMQFRMNKNILKVEKATNSHTDLLVATTREAAHNAGKQEERGEQDARDQLKSLLENKA